MIRSRIVLSLMLAVLAGSVHVLVAAQEGETLTPTNNSANAETGESVLSAADPSGVIEDELSARERRALRRSQRREERIAAAAARDAEQQDATTVSGDDDGVICRREVVTGSHRRVRVCTTRAQREAARDSNRSVITEVMRSGGDFGREGLEAGQ